MAAYVPEPFPVNADSDQMARWLEREFQKIEEMLSSLLLNPMEVSYAPPEKLPTEDILFAFADGTQWNPGSGRGFYYYDPSLAAWKKVQVV